MGASFWFSTNRHEELAPMGRSYKRVQTATLRIQGNVRGNA